MTESDEILLATPDFTVRQITVDGRTEHVLTHPGSVVVLALDEWGRVPLVRQYRAATGGELLELPAGTRRPDESPEACARRELAEETGYTAQTWRQLGEFYVAPGYSGELMTLFLATDLTPGQAQPEADESFELLLLPLPSLVEMAKRGELRDAKTIAGVMLAQAFSGRH